MATRGNKRHRDLESEEVAAAAATAGISIEQEPKTPEKVRRANEEVSGPPTPSEAIADEEDDCLTQLLASNAATPPRPQVTRDRSVEATFDSKGFAFGKGVCDHPIIIAPIRLKGKIVANLVTGSFIVAQNGLVKPCAPEQVNSSGLSLLQHTPISAEGMRILCEKGFKGTIWSDFKLFKQYGAVVSLCYPLHIGRCQDYYEGLALTPEEKLVFGNSTGWSQPSSVEEVNNRRSACERLIVELQGTNDAVITATSKLGKEYKRKVRIINYPIDVDSCEIVERLLCVLVCQ